MKPLKSIGIAAQRQGAQKKAISVGLGYKPRLSSMHIVEWGFMMKKRSILTIAAALAALPHAPAIASTAPMEPTVAEPVAEPIAAVKPNVLYQAGEELLGLVVTQRADGTVVAMHSSHVSHASHQSHHSHYSSR